jgi:hypothetical protein
MDTFGRLPTDVLTTINNLYQTPIIELIYIKDSIDFYLLIKYPYFINKIEIIPALIYNFTDGYHIDTLQLQQLNILCTSLKYNTPFIYKNEYNKYGLLSTFFSIEITKNEIYINRDDIIKLTLYKNNADNLYNALINYIKILKTFPDII